MNTFKQSIWLRLSHTKKKSIAKFFSRSLFTILLDDDDDDFQ